MLFNSYAFVFLFLPLAALGFFIAGRRSVTAAAVWLGGASLFFYGFWDWHNAPVLLGSILFNFLCGRWLAALVILRRAGTATFVLCVAVAANIACLGYYKYSGFFFSPLAEALGFPTSWHSVALPLGVSFFTFTQIAFLVDVARGAAREPRFDHYFLFVTYFPHLIAGPILHHSEIMPQFSDRQTYTVRPENIAVGTTIFVIGLFKKTVIADSLGSYADPIFKIAPGHLPTTIEAWSGALLYTFQIYFDFSAYMDMAIGISLLFNVRLPANFDSPYKSLSIIDFWRRWHITLSRFLRDYLYIPLGGNRKGPLLRYSNLMITMILGGLWHGAGWTFVVWGALHGVYLVLNHAWRGVRRAYAHGNRPSILGTMLSWALTFIAVVIAWVFFRAPDMHSAVLLLKGMAGLHGTYLPATWLEPLRLVVPLLADYGVHFGNVLGQGGKQLQWILFALATCILMPNLRQVFGNWRITLPLERKSEGDVFPSAFHATLTWRPDLIWACVVICALVISLGMMTNVSQFLYFQF